jgi:hypothetical protein
MIGLTVRNWRVSAARYAVKDSVFKGTVQHEQRGVKMVSINPHK